MTKSLTGLRFVEIFKAAVKTNPLDWDAWSHYAWCSHAIQGPGMRKPDVVLVKRHLQHDRSVTFGDIVTYCEVKQDSNAVSIQDAWRQIAEIAGLVLARQANRRFFIGLSICGAELRLALYARGAIVSSKPFNINDDPLLFIKVMLNLSCVDSVCHGFDENFIDLGQGNFELYAADLEVLVKPVKLFHSLSIKGGGPRFLCVQSPRGIAIMFSRTVGSSRGPPTSTSMLTLALILPNLSPMRRKLLSLENATNSISFVVARR